MSKININDFRDSKFEANLIKVDKNDSFNLCAAGEAVNLRKISEDLFGEKSNNANLFLYLFTRFGSPNFPCDPGKDVAVYTLTTPMEGLYLFVSIKGEDYLTYSFAAIWKDEIHDKINRQFIKFWGENSEKKIFMDQIHWAKKEGFIGKVNRALAATMIDLERPDYIRDIPINVYGTLSDEEAKEYYKPYKKEQNNKEKSYITLKFNEEDAQEIHDAVIHAAFMIRKYEPNTEVVSDFYFELAEKLQKQILNKD